jgi:ketosteroid isomerase-like protein
MEPAMKPAELVIQYLEAWDSKDAAQIAACLDPDVTFKGPLSQTAGRDAFLTAVTRMLPMLKTVKLRHLFVEGDTALAVYDFTCHAPVGNIRTCELLTLKDDLIQSSEIFFDARPLAPPQRSAA